MLSQIKPEKTIKRGDINFDPKQKKCIITHESTYLGSKTAILLQRSYEKFEAFKDFLTLMLVVINFANTK